MKPFSARALIEKTRDKHRLNKEEVQYLVNAYVEGTLNDYHLSAWLMAVYLNGLSREETVWLTHAMRDSGVKVPREAAASFWIDKHSTGGVGDKTSLILVPLVVTVCEKWLGPGAVRIPMVSGRGLGYTGGTLDKLESVPGFSSNLTMEAATRALEQNHFFMMGQTAQLVPADRKLYALRDCTATIESIPLIVASILSKKLAENLDGLVIDLKWGSGAFMHKQEDGRRLGEMLVGVARDSDVDAVAILSRMDEPLGYTAGHALEVQECYEYICDKRRERGLDNVTLALAGWMVSLCSRRKLSVGAATEACKEVLGSSKLEEQFLRMFTAQGGDWEAFQRRRESAQKSLQHLEYRAAKAGFLSRLDAGEMGRLLWEIGAGRDQVDAQIDLDVGLEFHKKVGDAVQAGEKIVSVYHRGADVAQVEVRLGSAIDVGEAAVSGPAWLSEVIDE
ncbi:MAG: thymidine phosphorylase [Bdellovibrionales bacterium]|nr:thymidine phosphorylase [Bdellovibrionales bacterium]